MNTAYRTTLFVLRLSVVVGAIYGIYSAFLFANSVAASVAHLGA